MFARSLFFGIAVPETLLLLLEGSYRRRCIYCCRLQVSFAYPACFIVCLSSQGKTKSETFGGEARKRQAMTPQLALLSRRTSHGNDNSS